jgi:hypothetical protein
MTKPEARYWKSSTAMPPSVLRESPVALVAFAECQADRPGQRTNHTREKQIVYDLAALTINPRIDFMDEGEFRADIVIDVGVCVIDFKSLFGRRSDQPNRQICRSPEAL